MLADWSGGELTSWTDDDLCAYLRPGQLPARLLNAGSGPFVRSSPLACAERAVHVSNCDQSARLFRGLASKYHIFAPLPDFCDLEDLDRAFPRAHYDLVHMRNALDHTVRPDAAVVGLVRLLRPGGVLLLRHFENVHYGVWNQLATGLHQWAITLGQEGHLLVENFDVTYNISEVLEPIARVVAWRENAWILASITRLANAMQPAVSIAV